MEEISIIFGDPVGFTTDETDAKVGEKPGEEHIEFSQKI